MSGRKGQMTREQQAVLGAMVMADIEAGMKWKLLERRYGRGRMQLWRYVQVHRAKMIHNNGKMIQNGSCLLTAAA